MPARINSRAVTKKLQSVAASLHASDHKRIVGEILAHLEEHTEQAPLCLKVLKANLLHHFHAESMGKGAAIPESSNKLGVLSKTLKRKLINGILHHISPQTLKRCEKADGDKFVDKLFYFLLAEVPSSPNLHEFELPFLEDMTVRAKAIGDRATWLKVVDEAIDWQASGIYKFGSDDQEQDENEKTEGNSTKANYIVHKPSNTKAWACMHGCSLWFHASFPHGSFDFGVCWYEAASHPLLHDTGLVTAISSYVMHGFAPPAFHGFECTASRHLPVGWVPHLPMQAPANHNLMCCHFSWGLHPTMLAPQMPTQIT